MKIINVVGARPNFMKMAPIMKEMKKHSELDVVLVHTGQHYDKNMSDSFFEELDIPKPDYNLGVGSGSHTEQTANIMIEFEKVCLKEKPNLVVVVGDVNSTIACALVAKKLHIKVAHVESGLRSFDWDMPEEINRVLTDRISDYLFVTEQSGIDNLHNEGVSDDKIFFVGNVMIDSLINNLSKKTDIITRLGLSEYCLVTMHRPSNVDTKEKLTYILDILNNVPFKIVWPIHPRTLKNIENFRLQNMIKDHIILEPTGYLDFITLVSNCKLVLTDSGGIQEETTYLGIPCITMRENTERPSTITLGTNQLLNDKEKILNAINGLHLRKHTIPPLWDGKAAERIVKVITE
jgi:UDP-N-acetylglucosamine 2-epimerase (non-hydrolysing)